MIRNSEFNTKEGVDAYIEEMCAGWKGEPAAGVESAQLWLVGTKPTAIKFLDSPSETVQLAAVKKNPNALKHIDSPSDDVIMQALVYGKSASHTMTLVKDPSERIQRAAMKTDRYSLASMNNPTETIQMEALHRFPEATLRSLKNPAASVLLAAVEKDGHLLKFIEDPSQLVVARAIVGAPDIIFDEQYSDKITPDLLDRIKPGLAAAVDQIKAVEGDLDQRMRLFASALATDEVEAIELPDLDFSSTEEPLKPTINYQSAFSNENWNAPAGAGPHTRSR